MMEYHSSAGTEPVRLTTRQSTHMCSVPVVCHWTCAEDLMSCCAQQVTCKSVLTHLGNQHGIKQMDRKTMIGCLWEGCHKHIQHKNFVQHVHKCHLGHPR